MDAVADEGLGVSGEGARPGDAEPELVVRGDLRLLGEEARFLESLPPCENRREGNAVAAEETGQADARGNATGPRALRLAEPENGAEDETGPGRSLEGGEVRLELPVQPEVVVVEKRDEGGRGLPERRVPHGPVPAGEAQREVPRTGGARRRDDARRFFRPAVLGDERLEVAERLGGYRGERLGEESGPPVRGEDHRDAWHVSGYSRPRQPRPASNSRNLGAVLGLLVAATLLASSPDGPVSPSKEEPPAAALARFAWRALGDDPAASPEDAYKWLFQAIRGGEHAAPSEDAARAWLAREWATLGEAAPGEPLVVPLRPDGGIVRLNLRPYRAAGGDPEALLAAFLESARGFRPDPGLFVEAWRELGNGLPGEAAGAMTRADFEEVDRASEAGGWPARHHSRAYSRAHAPAYRVLTGEAATRLVRSIGERP